MTKEIDEEEFPSNSKMTVSKRKIIDVAPKENPEMIKSKSRRVVKGRAMKRKKSPGSNLLKSFLGEDIGSVGGYIIHEVLIPAAKDTLREVVSGGIERLLFGEEGSRSSKRHRDSGRTVVSYGQYYNDRRTEPKKRRYSGRSRPVEEVIIVNRGEANDALEALQDILDDYQVVSVADMYEIVGFDGGDWSDAKWGWKDLRDARVIRVHEGYLLDLPDTIYID